MSKEISDLSKLEKEVLLAIVAACYMNNSASANAVDISNFTRSREIPEIFQNGAIKQLIEYGIVYAANTEDPTYGINSIFINAVYELWRSEG